ncbi:unnamed protein product [Protopolystoma xenopodis]|uniref:Uncharacterized protein n=1 Tax=Protopolystoma xenopodis TaxID=117903 RepID=A0A3S5AXI1_9PLAT|nr:unnamed protein product [Protopolystoma xenopodis]
MLLTPIRNYYCCSFVCPRYQLVIRPLTLAHKSINCPILVWCCCMAVDERDNLQFDFTSSILCARISSAAMSNETTTSRSPNNQIFLLNGKSCH